MSKSKAIHRGPNGAVVLIIALPAFAVLASVGTAMIAMTRGDPPLPGQYHWEGDRLDHDFAYAHRAAALGLEATLDLTPAQGTCHLSLRLRSDLPGAVLLDAVHASRPELDRQMRFTRNGLSNTYTAPCSAPPPGNWHLELRSTEGDWSYREDWSGHRGPVQLTAGAR
jgi:uncharacterized protein